MSATVLGSQDKINEWRLREFHRMLGPGSEELDPSQSVYFTLDFVQKMAPRFMDCTGSGRAVDGILPGIICM